MRNQSLLVAALFAASPFLVAQDEKMPAAAPAMPNPKVEAHDALKNLVGSWDSVCKMAAMPGVPGMEKPSETTGTEHAELICNGLWVKSVVNGTYQGQPFQGLWLAGYDPNKKKYTSVWVSSMDEPACTADGTYDEKTKTWTFSGPTPHGEMRSVATFQDADNFTETCYMKGPDGKEVECMQVTRKRSKSKPVEAAATAAKPSSKELAMLHEGIGQWDAVVKHAMPGAPATEDKATERVFPICNGTWTWSNFTGTMMGMPFEGHALCGYDSKAKKFVSYWIDSCSANASCTTGTHDEAKGVCTFEGTCVDEYGKPASIYQVYTQKDANTRHLKMTFKGEQGSHEMEIVYKRAKS
jgi:hypothetical protein